MRKKIIILILLELYVNNALVSTLVVETNFLPYDLLKLIRFYWLLLIHKAPLPSHSLPSAVSSLLYQLSEKRLFRFVPGQYSAIISVTSNTGTYEVDSGLIYTDLILFDSDNSWRLRYRNPYLRSDIEHRRENFGKNVRTKLRAWLGEIETRTWGRGQFQ